MLTPCKIGTAAKHMKSLSLLFFVFVFSTLKPNYMVRARAVFSNRSTSNKAPQVCFHTCLTYDETNVDFTVCLKRARCPCNERSIPSDIQNKNNNNKKKNMVNSTFQVIAPRKRLQNISSVIKSRSLYRTALPLFTTGFHSVHAASSNKSIL